MKIKHAVMQAALACLFVGVGAQQVVHAEQLVTWTFSGTVGDISKGYRIDDLMQDPSFGDSSWTPMYSPSERDAVDLMLAPFATGQAFTATVTVDLDSPYVPTDGVASFPGSIKSYQLTIPQAGLNSTSTRSAQQGVSITKDETTGGDVYYFYLPNGNNGGPLLDPGLSVGGAIYMTDPNGTQYLKPDLHEFAASFDPSKYSYILGGASIAHPTCGFMSCGDVGFNIQSVTVTAVPEVSTWMSMSLGLIGLSLLGRRRKQH